MSGVVVLKLVLREKRDVITTPDIATKIREGAPLRSKDMPFLYTGGLHTIATFMSVTQYESPVGVVQSLLNFVIKM